jgi:selenoprotein W-related protein
VVDLLSAFELEIETLTLIPSVGGRFEVTVDGHLLYSKLKTGRHADQGEVVELVRKYLQEGP